MTKVGSIPAFILAISIQLFALSIWFSKYFFIIFFAETIFLKARLHDPKNPYKGNYLVLKYDFSFLWEECDKILIRGDKVYVELSKSDDYWVAGGVAKAERPTFTYLTGTVIDSFLRPLEVPEGHLLGPPPQCDHYPAKLVEVNWGIEEFFIKEKSKKAFEDAEELKVTVKLGPGGYAVLRDVEILKRRGA